VFIHGMKADGTPDLVEEQGNIIDTVPGNAGYSAFWQVNMVTVPAGYQPNSIKSAAGVRNSGYQITETQMVVNCPVVTVGTAAASSGLPSSGTGPGNSGGSNLTYVLAGLLAAASVVGLSAGAFAFAKRRA
jgi:hypothetical protein